MSGWDRTPAVLVSEGDAMGLLEKRNPHATRWTVFRAALADAALFALFTLLMLFWKGFPLSAWGFMLAFMTTAGAIVGVLLEWQPLDDPPPEDRPHDPRHPD